MNLDNIKAQFPIFLKKINNKNLVYLDSSNSSQKPLRVIERMSQFYKNEDLTKEININDYSIHHPSYFFKANRVLIFNSQELDYVKNNFNNEIIKININ